MSRARKLADLLDASGDVRNDAMDNVALSDLDVTATAAEVNTLDGITASTAELNIMDGVTSTTAELNTLDGVTATASELNIMDGVTATTAELNIMDGVTATASEINTLDGVTASTAELNLLDGVTATTTELNYVDGVTSNIQTQIDNIASDLVDDTTPQLGGSLDVNGNTITSASNGDISIDPNGSGKTKIQGALEVKGNYNEISILRDYDLDGGAAGQFLQFGALKTGSVVTPVAVHAGMQSDGTADHLSFRLDGTDMVRIDETGDVGIGTTTIARGPLHVHNTTTSDSQVHLTNSTSGATASDGTTLYTTGVNAGIWHRENGYFRIATNNSEKFRIDASGRMTANIPHGLASHDSSTTWNSTTRKQGLDASLASEGVTVDLTNNRLKPTISGVYFIYGHGAFSGSSGSNAYTPVMRLRKNGSDVVSQSYLTTYSAGHTETHYISGIASFNGSTDYLEFWHSTNAGSMTSNGVGMLGMIRIS